MERIVDKIEALSKFFSVWRRFRRRLRNPIFWKRIWKIWWGILKKEKARKVFIEAVVYLALTVFFLMKWISMVIGGRHYAFLVLILTVIALAAHLNSLARLAKPLGEADQTAANIVRKHHDEEERAREEANVNPESREPHIARRHSSRHS